MKVDHGFNLKLIRAELDRATWEHDIGNPGTECRRVWLGTVSGLTPSGKYYQPFACSNVEPCPRCEGKGTLPPHRKRRIVKKWEARSAWTLRRFDRLYDEPRSKLVDAPKGMPTLGPNYQPAGHKAAYAFIARQPAMFRLRSGIPRPQWCPHCQGMGSREVLLDELWHEAVSEALGEMSVALTTGESGEDYFAEEYRDIEEDEQEEAS